jgi:hypothetical protein
MTTTQAGIPLAPSLCGNQGIEYAAVVNDQPLHTNNAYSLYDPTYLKDPSVGGTNQRIYGQSTWDRIGGLTSNCANGANTLVGFYNVTPTYSCSQFSINHRGYMYVHTTGLWRFTISAVDDAVIMWVGANATQGWNKPNAIMSLYFSYGPGAPSGQVALQLTAGQYMPFRIVYGQAVGGAAFGMSVTDPNGYELLNSNTPSSPYLVRYSCDRTTTPFPYTFGTEL